MKQNLRKLINYSIKKESKHLVLTLDELKEIQSADKKLRKLEKLEKENELLKLDNQDLHNQIKKNVKEHYKEFMEDYDCLLEEYHELYKVWEKLKKAIEILKEKKVDIPKLLANDFNNYNALAVFFGFKQLAQEEYELLKEVLKNAEN